MAKMTAVLHFSTGELLVTAAMVGRRQPISYRGYECEISFPNDNNDFDVHGYEHAPVLISEFGTGENANTYMVHVVQVVIRISGELFASEFTSTSSDPERDRALIARAVLLYDEATSVGQKLVDSYLGHVRATLGQFWIGFSMERSRPVWIGRLYDASGTRIPVGRPQVGKAMVKPSTFAVSAAVHGEVLRKVSSLMDPPLAETLLRDAQHLGWTPINIREAVLLAAIACEVKIKKTLEQLASDGQLALVELVLKHPRDVSVATAALFDKALKAVCGRSLREDDPGLFKAVTRLYEVRNKIAHRGRSVHPDGELWTHVMTAVGAFAYLDEILSSSG
jgi:hypothetical protein